MILRRIAEHFRKQEWTAIAIDFVIVVVGVFLATQVTNWNDARLTHERARDVTTRLLGDVRAEADPGGIVEELAEFPSDLLFRPPVEPGHVAGLRELQ